MDDFARINSFQDGSHAMQITLDVIEDDLVMLFESNVLLSADLAQWDGLCTVYYLNTYFTQKCTTLCQGEDSFKQWREGWIRTDVKSPVDQILRWQEAALAGEGIFHVNSVPAKELDEALSSLGEVYVISLPQAALDWRCFCDVDLDTIFGSNARLDAFPIVDVTLLYNADDWTLDAVLMEYVGETDYLTATVVIQPSDATPLFSLEDLQVKDGFLSEEWSMPGY